MIVGEKTFKLGTMAAATASVIIAEEENAIPEFTLALTALSMALWFAPPVITAMGAVITKTSASECEIDDSYVNQNHLDLIDFSSDNSVDFGL